MISVTDLPLVNAILNATSAVFLISGYVKIKSGDKEAHKKLMISALICSTLFLTSYLIYHFNVGSVPYPHHDWTRTLYFIILIPHVILAVVMTPMIITGVVFAIRNKFDKHKRLMKWTFPIWVYVSVTGVIIYLMLYIL